MFDIFKITLFIILLIFCIFLFYNSYLSLNNKQHSRYRSYEKRMSYKNDPFFQNRVTFYKSYEEIKKINNEL